MARGYSRILNRLSKRIFLQMDFKNRLEFEKKYLWLSLRRAKIFNWVVLFLSFYNFYLDFMLHQNTAVDMVYRRNLFTIHIIIFILSIIFLVFNRLLERKSHQIFFAAKALLLAEVSVTVFIGSILSLNSQIFTGNIDAYVMIIFAAPLIIPVYPKWVLLLYGVNHVLFLTGLSYFCTDHSMIIKQVNSTTTVLVAVILFLVLYRYNVTNFLNEKMLKKDKQTFIKLFEINPFPLLISRFEDGKIQYANHKAMLFYDIPEESVAALNHKHLYKNPQDFNNICKMLELDGKVTNYLVEQKTLLGQTKYAVVNYELVDYFGEKSILGGVSDVGEIRRIEKKLTLHASTDPLTGVLNRRAGMDLIKKRFEAARRNKKEFNLCFFDVDNLKIVNDTYGHLTGDTLIIDACKVVREELRPDDIIFRYGGDEFMVLFENSREQEVKEICARIARRFEALNQDRDRPYWIDASFGMFSHKPEMNLSLETIIEIVDKDMYHSKAKKKRD